MIPLLGAFEKQRKKAVKKIERNRYVRGNHKLSLLPKHEKLGVWENESESQEIMKTSKIMTEIFKGSNKRSKNSAKIWSLRNG